jgi:phosphate/sulfate permease
MGAGAVGGVFSFTTADRLGVPLSASHLNLPSVMGIGHDHTVHVYWILDYCHCGDDAIDALIDDAND